MYNTVYEGPKCKNICWYNNKKYPPGTYVHMIPFSFFQKNIESEANFTNLIDGSFSDKQIRCLSDFFFLSQSAIIRENITLTPFLVSIIFVRSHRHIYLE